MNLNPLGIFTLMTILSVAVLIFVSAYRLPNSFFANEVAIDSKEGAKEALSLLKDWTVWMAGIQTATIAALGLFAKDGTLSMQLKGLQSYLAVLVALFNTLALFFSAWLLTSLSSLMLRVYSKGISNFDFYNWPLYAYMEHSPRMKVFTVGFFAFWNHWLWAIGILAFGALSISLVVWHP